MLQSHVGNMSHQKRLERSNVFFAVIINLFYDNKRYHSSYKNEQFHKEVWTKI